MEGVGPAVGNTVGLEVGAAVGCAVGLAVGAAVGDSDGAVVGDAEGAALGDAEGAELGDAEGAELGATLVGCVLGFPVGEPAREYRDDASCSKSPYQRVEDPTIFAQGLRAFVLHLGIKTTARRSGWGGPVGLVVGLAVGLAVGL